MITKQTNDGKFTVRFNGFEFEFSTVEQMKEVLDWFIKQGTSKVTGTNHFN